MRYSMISFVALSISQLAISDAVSAQEAVPPEEVGEIIVTAERRAQSLQKLPTTASAITGEALGERQITRIDDLVRATPGLAVNDTGLGKFVNIRGVGKGADLPGIAAGVAYYVDGVPIPNQIFLETPFFDLDRIEVLRGPQGTLVGMNSTGGAMLIVSQNPRYGQVEGSAEFSYGNFDNVRARGVINLGLNENFGLRAAAEYDTRDSFFRNLGPAVGNPGNVDRLSVRGTLAGKLSDAMEVFIRAEHNRNHTDGVPSKPISGDPDPLYLFRIGPTSPAAPFSLTRDVVTAKDTRYTRGSGEIRIDVAKTFQLRSVTGYQKGIIHLVNDFDGAALPTARQQSDIRESVFSQEINLISNPGDKLDWVIGGFYLAQNTNGETSINAVQGNISGLPTNALVVGVVGRYRTRNHGLFGQATYHANDRLNLTLGLRYNREKHFSARAAQTTVSTPGGPVVILTSNNPSIDEALTGRFTVDYELSGDQFVYATISKGFKGGGVNDGGSTFAPETVWNYEAGLKSTFAGRHIRTQIGVFYNDYKKIQAEIFNPVTTLSAVGNFASAKIYGFELQGLAKIGGLGLDASVAYTKTDLGTASLVDPRYSATAAINLTHRQLNFSPEWSLSVGAKYEIALGSSFTLTPRVQYSHLSSQWASVFHVVPTDFIESRNIADASLTLAQGDKGWRVEAYGSNLLDESYVASKTVTIAGRPGRKQLYGAPRQYGIRVHYAF